jgi:putative tricarboxylic transport membrane protein
MIPLATSGSRRIPGVNVPTMTELGLNVTMANWRGVFAAPGINAAQRDALINLVTAIVRSPAWQKELETRKWTDVFMTEQPFQRELASDITKTEAVMKELGLA